MPLAHNHPPSGNTHKETHTAIHLNNQSKKNQSTPFTALWATLAADESNIDDTHKHGRRPAREGMGRSKTIAKR